MTLPPNIQQQISDREDELVKDMKTDNDRQIGYYQGFCAGHEAGATEWATRLHQVERENGKLKQCNTILEAATSTLNDQANAARALLEKVIYRHEGGLLPDRLLYNEIKSFLNGK